MKLTHLHILKYCQVGDVVLTDIVRLCPDLEYLDISGQQFFGSKGVSEISDSCLSLKYLFMNHANAIVYQPPALAILSDATRFKKLRFLVMDCPKMPEDPKCPRILKAKADVNAALRKVIEILGRHTVIQLSSRHMGLPFYPDMVKLAKSGAERDRRMVLKPVPKRVNVAPN